MTNAGALFVAITVVAAVSWMTTWAVRRHALQNEIFDVPNARSSHAVPTARGGGVGIVSGFMLLVAGLLLAGLIGSRVAIALLACGGGVALVGHLDDRSTLSAGLRFLVHLIASVATVSLIGGVSDPLLQHLGRGGVWLGLLMALLGVTWAINLFNFMDGIDAIAACEAIFVSFAAAVINSTNGGDLGLSIAMLGLGAATIGFLIWNWPPARIFMGDVGSCFLGLTLAVLALAANQHQDMPIEVPVILSGVFLVDATVTLLRRFAQGDRWFEAHRSHAYQQLARRWNSHLRVTLSATAINLFWLFPWAWLAAKAPTLALWCVLFALAPLIILAIYLGAGGRPASGRKNC